MNITIRKAQANDLNLIQELNNKLFEYETDNKLDNYIADWPFSVVGREYFDDLIKNQFVVIAEVSNKPVGYLAGSIYFDETYSYYEGQTAELNNMFVEEDYRHLGIGSKLVNTFIEWCKQQKAKRIFVTATVGNGKTISFYRKHGFSDLNVSLKLDL